MRMRQDFLDNWIALLESDKFQKNLHNFVDPHNINTRCAIGVLLNEEQSKK